jgi:hypothetical protein
LKKDLIRIWNLKKRDIQYQLLKYTDLKEDLIKIWNLKKTGYTVPAAEVHRLEGRPYKNMEP